jgi:ABC-type transport system involved in multi-copper enzyme maturation permease subunit
VGSRLLSIAANTFRETIRNKILYTILAFALLVIGLTWFLADLSVGEMTRIIVDIGLAGIHVFGVIMAVFLGITLIHQELERKTVYVILSKPVPRWEFLVGKALGLSGTLALVAAVMTVVLFGVHAAFAKRFEPGILIASAGIYMELILIVCAASFFSSFTTPVLSATFTLCLFLIGHVSRDLVAFGGRSAWAAVRWGAFVVYCALPDLELFNWKNEVAYGGLRSISVLLLPAGYLVAYGGGVLLLACLLFSRKDFK